MTPEEIRARFRLARARPGAAAAAALLARYGSAQRIVERSAPELVDAGLSPTAAKALAQPDESAIARDLAWLAEAQNCILWAGEAGYPDLLARIDDPPLLLYLRGRGGALDLPAIAIVGSRNPTRGGIENAYRFSRHLARAGFCIVSGLAQGIDRAAHQGALDAGGVTAAFLGHGIDSVYPAANRELASRIAVNGALVSEYPLGAPPRREHFPQRNRLISGSCLGVLVIEAAKRSGSLITARLAAEQGREVFAIPGSIHNAMSRGCHRLIREGAKLVESADDVIDELGPLARHVMQNAAVDVDDEPAASAPPKRDDDYERLLDALGHDPSTADELAEISGLTIAQVSSMLLILELEGEVEALNGGQYGRRGSSSRHERERARRTDVPV